MTESIIPSEIESIEHPDWVLDFLALQKKEKEASKNNFFLRFDSTGNSFGNSAESGQNVCLSRAKTAAKIKSCLALIQKFNTQSKDYAIYLAGGAVRDFCFLKKPKDFDLFVISKKKKKQNLTWTTYQSILDEFKNEFIGFMTELDPKMIDANVKKESGKKNKDYLAVLKKIGLKSCSISAKCESDLRAAYHFTSLNFKDNGDKKAEIIKYSIFNLEVLFSVEDEATDKIQILFRPDHYSIDQVVEEFDLKICQFYAINNPDNSNLLFDPKNNKGPFFVKHAEYLIETFEDKEETVEGKEEVQAQPNSVSVSAACRHLSFCNVEYLTPDSLSEYTKEEIRMGRLDEGSLKQIVGRAFKFLYEKDQAYQPYPENIMKIIIPALAKNLDFGKKQ